MRSLKDQQYRSPEPPTLSQAEIDEDPHGIYRRLRPITPVIRREGGSYIAIRGRDVQQLATDPRIRKSETEVLRARGITEGPIFEIFSKSMLYSNGQDHRRRRLPLSRAVAFKLIDALRPKIRSVADALIDRHFSSGAMSFTDDFCAVIPAHLICMILGLPELDIPRFTHWVHSLSRYFGFSFLPAEIPGIQTAAMELAQYMRKLLDARREAPRDDFLSSFVATAERDGTLSAAEILAQILTVIVGGIDTTRGAMAVQVALLLQHREQWDAVRTDEALIPGAVSEALRFEPVGGSISRVTVEDIPLDQYIIPSNSVLSLSTLSAMRDPDLYHEPDIFNIRRADHPRLHPVFGAGAHRCLGEALARAELEETLAAVVSRLPQLRLAGNPPVVHGHSGIRRVGSMHVSWPT